MASTSGFDINEEFDITIDSRLVVSLSRVAVAVAMAVAVGDVE